MRITPIAFDSLGVRSMATLVETDLKILLDPGAALGPKRYGLEPHELERKRLKELLEAIEEKARECQVLVITHYHYDHYEPSGNFYGGKLLLIKHASESINKSQQQRAKLFLEHVKGEKFEFADARSFEIQNTKIEFSKPFWHGPPGTRLGYVLSVLIEYRAQSLLFTSDVQGPIATDAKEWIVEKDPRILIVDGPPTIFVGWKLKKDHVLQAQQNLIEIMEKSQVETVVLDHHLVRDLKYKEWYKEAFKKADELGVKIMTAAEFAGQENMFLEAHRKDLWEGKFGKLGWPKFQHY